jgi:hypothetical protein
MLISLLTVCLFVSVGYPATADSQKPQGGVETNPPYPGVGPALSNEYVSTIETALKKELKPLADGMKEQTNALLAQTRALEAQTAALTALATSQKESAAFQKDSSEKQIKLLETIAASKEQKPLVSLTPKESSTSVQSETEGVKKTVPTEQEPTMQSPTKVGRIPGEEYWLFGNGEYYHIKRINGQAHNMSGKKLPSGSFRRMKINSDGSESQIQPPAPIVQTQQQNSGSDFYYGDYAEPQFGFSTCPVGGCGS